MVGDVGLMALEAEGFNLVGPIVRQLTDARQPLRREFDRLATSDNACCDFGCQEGEGQEAANFGNIRATQ
jgi:hypothetical protein